MKLNTYDVSISDLQTLEEFKAWIQGIDITEFETTVQDLAFMDYQDTYMGIDIYYCHGGDYYVLAKS